MRTLAMTLLRDLGPAQMSGQLNILATAFCVRNCGVSILSSRESVHAG